LVQAHIYWTTDCTRAQQLPRWATVWPVATIGMGRKWGGAAVVAGSPLGPHLTQRGLGRGLPLYQVASWSI